MDQRDLFQIVVVRTDGELVEVIQIPAVQRDRIAHTDGDEISHGHVSTKILTAQDNDR